MRLFGPTHLCLLLAITLVSVALSPELQGDDASDRDLKQGFIINSLTKEILPAEFVPIFIGYNWIKFNPRKTDDPKFDPNYEPGAIIHRTSDPNDPIVLAEGKWGEDGSAPTITKFINVFAQFIGEPMPVILSFAKTSFKAGRTLISLCAFTSGNGKIFANKYRLVSKKATTKGFNYFVYKTEPAGPVDEATFKQAAELYHTWHGKDFRVHEEETVASEE